MLDWICGKKRLRVPVNNRDIASVLKLMSIDISSWSGGRGGDDGVRGSASGVNRGGISVATKSVVEHISVEHLKRDIREP